MNSGYRIVLLGVFGLLLVGCMPGVAQPQSPTTESTTTATTSTGPGYGDGLPEPPSPTVTQITTTSAPTAPGHLPDTTEPLPSAVADAAASSTTVAVPTAPGWTRYDSINQIRDLAFAPDGTLWASTWNSLVHWDLSTGTSTRYLIQVRDIAAAPDGTLWLVTEHGVCHFDGATCTAYTEAGVLQRAAVDSIAVAPDGVVWLGTELGVSRFDGISQFPLWTLAPNPEERWHPKDSVQNGNTLKAVPSCPHKPNVVQSEQRLRLVCAVTAARYAG